jgi:sortase A
MRRLINSVLELVLTAGVVVLLFVVYQAYVTDLAADRAQERVADDLRTAWDEPDPEPREFGEAFAFLHVPALEESWAVLEGTDEDTLRAGPGHYVSSALPGEVGNFSVAGHRVGTGAPFRDLDELAPGDLVVVETVDTWFTYEVTATPQVVLPTDVSVIRPVPGGSLDATPVDAYLTLTTCHPEFSAKQRLVVHALLKGSVSKEAAPRGPAVLAAGG